MRRLRYTKAAERDLDNLLEYLTIQIGRAAPARAVVGKVRAQCRKLAVLPGTVGRPRPELLTDLRSFPFGSYIIFFRYREDAVDIVNIIHARRDPIGLFPETDN